MNFVPTRQEVDELISEIFDQLNAEYRGKDDEMDQWLTTSQTNLKVYLAQFEPKLLPSSADGRIEAHNLMREFFKWGYRAAEAAHKVGPTSDQELDNAFESGEKPS